MRLPRIHVYFQIFSQCRYRYSTNTNVFTVRHTNTYIQTPLAFNMLMWGWLRLARIYRWLAHNLHCHLPYTWQSQVGGVLVLRTFQLVPQYIKESLSKLAEVVSIALCPCFLARNIVFLVLKLPMHIAGSKMVYYSQLSIPTSATRRRTPGTCSIRMATSGAP